MVRLRDGEIEKMVKLRRWWEDGEFERMVRLRRW